MSLRRSFTTKSGAPGQSHSSPNISVLCHSKQTSSATARDQVVLKCAPEIRIHREREILQQFEGHSCLRNFIDHGKEPPFLALEYLELDALKASGQAKLSRQDIKFIARSVLTALESLHAKGIAHTGILSSSFALLAR